MPVNRGTVARRDDTLSVLFTINCAFRRRALAFDGPVALELFLDVGWVIHSFFRKTRCKASFVMMDMIKSAKISLVQAQQPVIGTSRPLFVALFAFN